MLYSFNNNCAYLSSIIDCYTSYINFSDVAFKCQFRYKKKNNMQL